jgi:DNA-binding CsgD family transcriptional regulator
LDYRAILDKAPLPILVIQDSVVAYCNAAGYEVFRYCGYAVDESNIATFDLAGLISESERDEARRCIARLRAEQGPLRNIPATLLDARGHPVQTLTSASLIRWNGREAFEVSYVIVGLYPVLHDSPVRGLAATAPFPPGAPSSLHDARQLILAPLTPQERRVALGLADGQSTTEIARRMSIQQATLRGYIKAVYRKLGVHSRTELVRLLLGHR